MRRSGRHRHIRLNPEVARDAPRHLHIGPRLGQHRAPDNRPGGPRHGHQTPRRGTIRRLLGLLRPYRPQVAAVVACGLGGIAFNVLGPRLLGRATDLIVAGYISRELDPGVSEEQALDQLRDDGRSGIADMLSTVGFAPGHGIEFGQLVRVLSIALVLFAMASVLTAAQARVAATVIERVVFNLRQAVAEKIARLPLSYYDHNPQGELLSRVTNDVDNLDKALQRTLNQVVTMVFTLVGALTLMLTISPQFTLIVVIVMSLSTLLTALIGKRAKPRFAGQWEATGKLNAHVEETYTGHSLVKLFDRRELMQRTFDKHNEAQFTNGVKAWFVSETMMPVMEFVTAVNYLLLAVLGAMRVASGSMSVGEVQAFIQYSLHFGSQIIEMAGIGPEIQSGLASAERIFTLLDTEEQRPDPRRPIRLPAQADGLVEFERVSFSYSPDTPLIEDLSLTVLPGQTLAIVGPTGAGKTTLGNLLMRFYEVTGGRILLDGADIAAMTRADLRARVGLVLQDTWLFHGTIAENIAFGRAEATREEVITAAQVTRVDDFVRTMPDGYDTVVDDEALDLSAGQKQLITIARTLLANPPVLVLDEATSSVDTRTEVLIRQAMASVRAGRTSIVIAHRLSTIRNADLIAVMESGRVVECGTHHELISQGGMYSRLCSAEAPPPGTAVGDGARHHNGHVGGADSHMTSTRAAQDLHIPI